ncbi:hypothetical protein THRCLA_08581 [Thraustotheca clavata]|uniref:WLM domain-containing protein n=1 Tax=Thraustotheca clavata TaxID=74557 RepID=A0A1V9Z4P9_9STRA|nr:hypothetical protein THRCLA_08581 [Thraustotheca clavata]
MEWRIPLIQALKRQPEYEEAQRMLEKIASYVLPILCNRKYRVRQLLEFAPKNPNLLGMNVNHGYNIYVRLRPAAQPHRFLPFNDVLGTMLHELVHNKIGPHNAAFYKLLDELKLEMELLMAQGLTGNTGTIFQNAGQGHVLGGIIHRNPKRARLDILTQRSQMPGAFRLGGDSTATANLLTPAMLRMKALEAAERRQKDQLTCASHLEATTTHNEEESWGCAQCTYLNQQQDAICAMCDASRPSRKRKRTIDLSYSPPHVIDLTD